jgi:hypothetical protein
MRDNGAEVRRGIHLEEEGRQADSSPHRAPWRTAPTGKRCRWILRNLALWVIFHRMRQVPEVSLSQYGFLYILRL